VVVSLGWVSLLTDIATEAAYPLLPEFLKSIGAGAGALGIMEGIAESTSAILKWAAGSASDRRRRKPFVLAGYAVATLARPFLAIATQSWHVVLVRTTDRIGKGIRTAPRDALLAHAVPAERRGYAFGFHTMMDNVGAAIGPLAAFALVHFFGWSMRAVFAATLVPGLLAVATVFWGVNEERAPAPEGPGAVAKAAAPDTTARRLPASLRGYLGIVFLFTLGASADSFLMLRISDLGLDVGWVPLAWISLSLSKALLNMPGGKLSDRIGRRRAQVAGWLVYAAAYALFPFAQTVATTWLLLVAYGAYYGLTEGGEKALLADLAPPELRGRAFGALHAVTGLGVLPANLLFGALYSRHVAAAFWFSAGCAVAAAALLALVPAAKAPSR
jgi:MFS family permease